jgi:hypothetical protein
VAGLLFLQMRRIEQDDAGQFLGCRGRDDFTFESALDQERQAAAMVQMCVGQQDVVDGGRVEAERFRILLVQLTSALIQAAIDQDVFSGALDHMAGARHASGGTMK